MSIVKVDAVSGGEETALRTTARAMDGADGFLGYEVLRPIDGRRTWLVLTRWRDELAYELWRGTDPHGGGGPPAETWTFALAAGSGVD